MVKPPPDAQEGLLNGHSASRSRRGRQGRMLVVVGVLAGALTGCGGDARGSSPAAGTPVTTTAASAPVTSAAEPVDSLFADARFGFEFRFPLDWLVGAFEYDLQQTEGVEPAASAAVGLDEHNSILLTRYDLAEPVTAAELPDQLPELDGVVTGFAGEASEGEMTEIGGLPAVRYEEFPLPSDVDGRSSRVVFLFDGNFQYELNCQSTPEGRDRINQGCDQMLTTLRQS